MTRRIKPTAIVPDTRWPKMFRVRLSDSSLTDLVNRARAREILAGDGEARRAERALRRRSS